MRFIIAFNLLLSACANQPNLAQLLQTANSKAMQLVDIPSHGFVIRTYQHLLDNNASINVYIEGDGFAYINKSQASTDPTPHNPVGLALAVTDTAANVIYIARPCQYTLKKATLAKCLTGQINDFLKR